MFRTPSSSATSTSFEDWLLLSSSQQQQQQQQQSSSSSSSTKNSNNTNTIRIFISSTFSDMTKERDLVATRVAPRVNKFAESLGITATFVDLRWGVTAEQSQANDTVAVCLDQVLKSDIVIGFCGHRYGWHSMMMKNDENENRSNLLIKSILHAAEAFSSKEMSWLHPVLLPNNSNTSSGIGNYLLSSSVTELEVRCAFMKERFKNNSNNNIHIFIRTQSHKSETEECSEARVRLNTMRNVLSTLPNTKRYQNLSKITSSSSASSTEQDSSSSSSMIIKSANALEEEIFKAICESIFNIFPDRRDRQKPRKWEREGQIQQVLSDRSLNGFCPDF